MTDLVRLGDVITFRLSQFRKRVVFDILAQRQDTIWDGADDGNYYMFIASNDVQIISRSRMDIQTERLWLRGAKNDSHADRSGTMVFAMQEMCDVAFPKFHNAIVEWADMIQSGKPWPRVSDYRPKKPVAFKVIDKDGGIVDYWDDKDTAIAWMDRNNKRGDTHNMLYMPPFKMIELYE